MILENWIFGNASCSFDIGKFMGEVICQICPELEFSYRPKRLLLQESTRNDIHFRHMYTDETDGPERPYCENCGNTLSNKYTTTRLTQLKSVLIFTRGSCDKTLVFVKLSDAVACCRQQREHIIANTVHNHRSCVEIWWSFKQKNQSSVWNCVLLENCFLRWFKIPQLDSRLPSWKCSILLNSTWRVPLWNLWFAPLFSLTNFT